MEAVRRLNLWYDGLPELLRFPTVLAVLVLVGALNMVLTIDARFPFGLLVLIAILILALIRVPYARSDEGRAARAASVAAPAAPPYAAAPHAGWAHGWNQQYERLPELWRFPAILGALVVVGAINMALTISSGFPFGLLVLLAIIGIAAIRMPHAIGWGRAVPAHPPAALEPPSPALEAPAPLPPLASVPTHAPVEHLPSRAATESPTPHTPEESVPLHTTHEHEGATSHPSPEDAPAPIPPQDAALPPELEGPRPPLPG